MKGKIARAQLDAESVKMPVDERSGEQGERADGSTKPGTGPSVTPKPAATPPKRFHGTVTLDETRVGRDASRIADEVIADLTGLVGAKVIVTLEIEAEIPSGGSDHVVRTVNEISQTLNFSYQGSEKE